MRRLNSAELKRSPAFSIDLRKTVEFVCLPRTSLLAARLTKLNKKGEQKSHPAFLLASLAQQFLEQSLNVVHPLRYGNILRRFAGVVSSRLARAQREQDLDRFDLVFPDRVMQETFSH